jgi:hypothetical protein
MQHIDSLAQSGQRGKIPAQIPIFPAKSLVIIMKVPARLTQYPQLHTCVGVCSDEQQGVCGRSSSLKAA